MFKKCILAGLICIAGTSAAMAKTYHIYLANYCNQFILTVDGFQVYGHTTGCGTNSPEGGTYADVNGVPYIISNDESGGHPHIYTWYFTPPVNKAGSWYLYDTTSNTQTALNSGTYTVGAAATSDDEALASDDDAPASDSVPVGLKDARSPR